MLTSHEHISFPKTPLSMPLLAQQEIAFCSHHKYISGGHQVLWNLPMQGDHMQQKEVVFFVISHHKGLNYHYAR
jgi:hypothetical protein